MVFKLLGSKAKKSQSLINIAEVYSLWDILKAEYSLVEKYEILENFIHDPELLIIIKSRIKAMKQNIRLLEKLHEKYAIKGPDSHLPAMNSAVNAEIMRDQIIGLELLTNAQEIIEMLVSGVRDSTTNDGIRKVLIDMVKDAINRLDIIIKYVKLKGYIDSPPLFPHLPSNIKEKIDNSEAFHLWHHLSFRYDNVQLNEIYYSFANDGDFKLVLKEGGKVLNDQANILKKELQHFGIPLPIRPPSVMPPAKTTELLEDDSMFRTVLSGTQGALSMHTRAVKLSVTNDRIRKFFEHLLLSEIEIVDKMIKYGKTKGWLNPTPRYGIIRS